MARAPISGIDVWWTAPTGHYDLFLAETRPGLAAAVGLVSRRGRTFGGEAIDARGLPVGDVDALVVALRQEMLGDHVVAEGRCTACDAAVDVDFGLRDYTHHLRPRASRSAIADGEAGWWRLRAHQTRFRIPTAGDVLAASTAERPRDAMIECCVEGDRSARALRAVERALSTLAPTLRNDVAGSCPHCGRQVVLDVDVRELCLQELRFLSGAVLEEVHLLAMAYGWDEAAILDLPSPRRGSYAALIGSARTSSALVGAFDG